LDVMTQVRDELKISNCLIDFLNCNYSARLTRHECVNGLLGRM